MYPKQQATINQRIKEEKRKVLEALRETPVVHVACKRSGIAKATFYRWKEKDPVFAAESEEALKSGKELVSDMAISQLISAIKDKNLGAIKFWLSNHHPDYKTKVEIGGQLALTPELSPEQQALVQEALRLAGLYEERT
ncbi:MAG: hypothetical protein IPK84_01655 [Candidatus Moraniibacteriota bacterium]|nr:MAG: hypothetical protein IPK84_01655 [Candidatus Moranbacteria bacterium]